MKDNRSHHPNVKKQNCKIDVVSFLQAQWERLRIFFRVIFCGKDFQLCNGHCRISKEQNAGNHISSFESFNSKVLLAFSNKERILILI